MVIGLLCCRIAIGTYNNPYYICNTESRIEVGHVSRDLVFTIFLLLITSLRLFYVGTILIFSLNYSSFALLLLSFLYCF